MNDRIEFTFKVVRGAIDFVDMFVSETELSCQEYNHTDGLYVRFGKVLPKSKSRAALKNAIKKFAAECGKQIRASLRSMSKSVTGAVHAVKCEADKTYKNK